MKSVRKEGSQVGRNRRWVGEVRMKEGRMQGMSWDTANDAPQACSEVSMCPEAPVLCFLDKFLTVDSQKRLLDSILSKVGEAFFCNIITVKQMTNGEYRKVLSHPFPP